MFPNLVMQPNHHDHILVGSPPGHRSNGTRSPRQLARRSRERIPTGSEASYERIARVAADLFEVPVSVINFTGRDRGRVTVTEGIDDQDAGPLVNFCLRTIQLEETTVVRNAEHDTHRKGDPSVPAKSGIQFYAGTPLLTSDGSRIGTLCVLDTEPRNPTPDRIRRLEDLAVMVMREVERQEDDGEQRESATASRHQNLLEETQRLAGAWEIDLRSGTVTCSEKVYEIHEVEPGTPIEKEEVVAFYAPEARPTIRKAFDRCITEGQPYDLELPIVTATGRRRWIRTVGSPVEGDDGRVVKVAGAMQDITERKQDDRRRQQVISRVTDAIVEVDAEWRITLLNTQAEEAFDKTEENLLGKPFWEVFSEGLDTRFEQVYRSVMDTREPERFEEFSPASNGWLDVQVYPNDDGGIAIYFDEVTARKEQERELRERGRKLKQIRENVTDVVWMSAPDKSEMQFISDAYEEVWGRPTEQLKERPESFAEAIHSEDRERVLAALEAQNEAPGAYDETYRVVQPDGEVRWVRDHSAGIYNDRGELERILGTATDITERKRSRQRLERYREYTDRLLDASGDLLMVFDESGNLQRWNEAVAATSGYSDEELDGMNALALVPESEREQTMSAIKEVFETGESHVETHLLTKEGVTLPYELTGNRVEHPDGDLRLVSIGRDITDRKCVEESLRESEQRFRGVFENAGLGIALLTQSGIILEANPALHAMLEYGEEDLHGRHFEDVTYEDDVGTDKERFAELIEGVRDQYQLEKRYVRQNGDTFWGHLTVSRTETSEGMQIVGVVEDIDEQKRYEKQLRKAKVEAERTNQLKTAFLANMSHEIRTPLTSILGFSEAIGDEISEPEEKPEAIDHESLRQFAGLIQKSGRRLMETLNGVLTLSKLEAGEMDLSTEAVDLAPEIEEAVAQAGSQSEEAGLDLEVERNESVFARANKGALQIVLDNLLSNAVKYTNEGGRIRVRCHGTEEAAIVEVEDSGIGMNPGQVEKLFEPFRQASEGPSRQYEGTGLGLAVSTQAIEQMGGSIDVDTVKGEGSCFTVRLPRVTEDDA